MALKDVTFNVGAGEFFAILGPSGCGKTTLLRVIAGLLTPTSGTIETEGMRLGSLRCGFVFQDPVLLPWRNALDNVALPLEINGTSPQLRMDRAHDLLKLVGLSGFENSLPRQLSGGMQQRVSIARALANDPELLLMDEPFSALDAITKVKMNRELLRVWQDTGKTVIFVTHSVSDAVFLADRVAVMTSRPGRILEITEINLPRPRIEGAELSPASLEYCRKLLAVLSLGELSNVADKPC